MSTEDKLAQKDWGTCLDYALLGEFFDRKNRGRGLVLDSLDKVVTLIDCVGVNSLASQITITCGLQPSEPIPPPPGLEQARPAGTVYAPAVRGILEWGNDGVETEAEFDFVAGTVLSLSAGSVRLKAQLEADTDTQDPSFVAPNVVAHVGYYPRGGQNAQRTLRTVDLDEAQTQELPIPPFARSVTMIGNRTAPGGVSRAIEMLPAIPFGLTLAAAATTDPVFEMPIPQRARVLRVTNLGEIAEALTLIFRLWL